MPAKSFSGSDTPYSRINIRERHYTRLNAADVWFSISRAFAGADLPMPEGFFEVFDHQVRVGLDFELLQDALEGVPPDQDHDVLRYARLVLDLASRPVAVMDRSASSDGKVG